ncbi:hypothetical protein NDN08_006737 [Rhodosorus marinus]|uniref:Glycolipid transfer protein domain-containing protein n=1 Tax=Rhodosorus marinus TaxID=101924 RepID=A0AAV8UIH2_9RHOD|nr:hypothetical protein NDN08_006737 [Rhodosorus marinus]
MFGLLVDFRSYALSLVALFCHGLFAALALGVDLYRWRRKKRHELELKDSKAGIWEVDRVDDHPRGVIIRTPRTPKRMRLLSIDSTSNLEENLLDELDTTDEGAVLLLKSFLKEREIEDNEDSVTNSEGLDSNGKARDIGVDQEEERLAEIRRSAELEAAELIEGDVIVANEREILSSIISSLRNGDDNKEEQSLPSHGFDEVTGKFEVVEIRGPQRFIELHTFSNAVLSFTLALNALGGWLPINSFVQNDIINNVRKTNLACKRVNAATLQEMVAEEMAKGVEWSGSGREALLWLKRTLQFSRRVLVYCVKFPDVSLQDDIQRSYREALAPCHNWAVRPIFGLCLRAMPSRETFLERLGPSKGETLGEIDAFLACFNPIVASIVTYFNEAGLEDRTHLEI